MSRLVSSDPFDLVVVGGTGDLALQKLFPALFYRHENGQLADGARIIGAARASVSPDEYLAMVEKGCRANVEPQLLTPAAWESFARRITYAPIDVLDPQSCATLAPLCVDAPGRARVFYLATSPELFGPTCRSLGAAGMTNADAKVVLEKPIGHDLASSQRINDEVGAVFPEAAVFRIDHYLGKETVQNLMVLRFANMLFERLWNADSIDHVQITVAETVGVETRAAYYDGSGALRDMVQNHILQLLCLVAMEPPVSFEPDTVRDEKLKVLRALRPIEPGHVGHHTVRGQYDAGSLGDQSVRAYLDEADVPAGSETETFAVVRAHIDSWRWAGVPFYLRTGKRMAKRCSEIIIQFRNVPHHIFPSGAGRLLPGRLVIRLQPDEAVRLHLMTKVPGPGGLRVRSEALNLSFAETFKTRTPGAYERLLGDVVRGNATLFMRRDEVEAAWHFVEPILEGWRQAHEPPRRYKAGSWGPSASIALIERDGRTWHEDML